MAIKVNIKAREIENYEFERALSSWLDTYSEETNSVIEMNTEEIPEGYEFYDDVWNKQNEKGNE